MPALDQLSWYRARCTLVNQRCATPKPPPAFVVVQAMVKQVTTTLQAHLPRTGELTVIFHLLGKNFRFSARPGETVTTELLFFRCDEELVGRWLELFQEYFRAPSREINWQLLEPPQWEKRSYPILEAEKGITKREGELCLEFLTPVPFKLEKNHSRTFLSEDGFVQLFLPRFQRLFGTSIPYLRGQDQFKVLPYYWRYTQVPHRSASQPGTIQHIKGCFGPLYVKGRFANLLPLLILGSEVHAGSKLPNGQGYYLLKEHSPPYFARFFPDQRALLQVLEELAERYDHPPERALQAQELLTNPQEYARQLCTNLAKDQWVPSPSTAFVIRKADGSERLLEQVPLPDLAVHQFLLRTIEKPFDRFFEESSVGYRKGGSREKVVAMVQQAIADGFQYVVESDISDFFPSVDLQTLSRLLDTYLPEGDALLRSLLQKCLFTPYVFRGQLHQREQGLAQGSPLSPILANLYLDAFDEHMAALGVRLIRYADDFILMTKTREQAEKALAHAQHFLAQLGLKTAAEKTAIKSVEEGFQFLGIRFTRSEAVIQPEEELRRLKKPLYVTEPFVFLSINGEAVEIRRDGTPLQTIPLRRLSEIIVMENASFSTALLRKCTAAHVPLTLTLGSGYYVTTLKPDSREYYQVAFAHARRWQELQETERLAIAKEIVLARIANSMAWFRQKYLPGTDRTLKLLAERMRAIQEAPNLETLRGLEGAATRVIFSGFNALLEQPAFHLHRRMRHPPDRINSLLNLGYYLLFGRLNATVRAVGLNPYLGFLHSPEDSFESLVADLQEPFRPRVERLVAKVVNLRIIGPADFVETPKGMYLTREAKKRFLHHFEAELAKPAGKDTLAFADALYYQVLTLKKWALEGSSLTFYRWQT